MTHEGADARGLLPGLPPVKRLMLLILLLIGVRTCHAASCPDQYAARGEEGGKATCGDDTMFVGGMCAGEVCTDEDCCHGAPLPLP